MAEAFRLIGREGLALKSAVEVHQLPHHIIFCRARVVHISIAPTTFLYCLYTCLSLDGKALLCGNGFVAARQRFALLFDFLSASYPPLFLSNGFNIQNGSVP